MRAQFWSMEGMCPASIVAFAALGTLLCITMISCADGGPSIPEEEERSQTYAAPSWSVRGVIAYGDRGFRDVAGAGVYVDSLAGIWTYDTMTHARRKVLPRANYPSWSPDGLRLAYWSNYTIGILDVETGVARPLVDGDDHNNPAQWAPCGNSLIHVSTRGAPYDYTIWTIDPETGIRQNVTPGEGGLRDPIWFAGCDSVLHRRWVTVDGMPADSVYVMSRQTLAPRALFDSGSDESALGMSPDGRYVSYTAAGSDGRARIYIYDRRSHMLVGKSGSLGRDIAWDPRGDGYVYVGRSSVRQGGVNSVLVFVDSATGRTETIR